MTFANEDLGLTVGNNIEAKRLWIKYTAHAASPKPTGCETGSLNHKAATPNSRDKKDFHR